MISVVSVVVTTHLVQIVLECQMVMLKKIIVVLVTVIYPMTVCRIVLANGVVVL